MPAARKKNAAAPTVAQTRRASSTARMIATAPRAKPMATKTRMARPPTIAAARRASSWRSSTLKSSKRVRPRSRIPASRLRADSSSPGVMGDSSFAAQEDAEDQADAGADAHRGPRVRAHLAVDLGAGGLQVLARRGERCLGALAHFLHLRPGLVGSGAQELLGVGDHGFQVAHQVDLGGFPASLGGFHATLPGRIRVHLILAPVIY